MIYVLDGYNVLHRTPAFRAHFARGLQAAREALVRFCAEWIATRRDVAQFWIVFDGAETGSGLGEGAALGVRVVYSVAGESADERIVSLVEELGRFRACTVVSDDREVIRKAGVLGAAVMAVGVFARIPKGRRGRVRKNGDGAEKETALPEHVRRQITESLKRVWS